MRTARLMALGRDGKARCHEESETITHGIRSGTRKPSTQGCGQVSITASLTQPIKIAERVSDTSDFLPDLFSTEERKCRRTLPELS